MEEYYNCQWAQEDVKTSYNLPIIIIINTRQGFADLALFISQQILI
jgi:hypothetical protein